MFRNFGRRQIIVSVLLTIAIVFASSTSQATQKKKKVAKASAELIWADPGEIESLDFVGGPGGRDGAPTPPFTFIEESLSGTMLTSNFDNKDVRDVNRGSNTAIFQVPIDNGLENRYAVSDWGGSMGKWGGFISREKWDCKGFRSQTGSFIKGVEGNIVEFGFSGQHTGSFKNDIRVSDLKWLLQYVGRITDDQFRDGLRASGATPDEVECFTRSLRERINQMKRISGNS